MANQTQREDDRAPAVPAAEGRGVCKISPNHIPCHAGVPLPRPEFGVAEFMEKLDSLQKYYERRRKFKEAEALKNAIRALKRKCK